MQKIIPHLWFDKEAKEATSFYTTLFEGSKVKNTATITGTPSGDCDTQKGIDTYWGKLSAHPESEQCGWFKDKYGVSWQIVPSVLSEIMASGNKEKIARVTQAFLKMKKFDIKTLEDAFNK